MTIEQYQNISNSEIKQLESLPNSHRPNVKAFLRYKGINWIGCRQGMYRIQNDDTHFLDEWQGQEIIAIGQSKEGVLVATSEDKHSIYQCDMDGKKVLSLPYLLDDTPTCLFQTSNILVGGKHNLYKLSKDSWSPCLSDEHAGEIGWIRKDKEILFTSVLKGNLDQCPRLLISKDDGATWESVWIGTLGDRIQSANLDKIICKWTGDQVNPSLLQRPILASHICEDGRIAFVQNSTLTIVDQTNSEIFRLCNDLISRTFWITIEGERAIIAGEQGIHTINMNTGTIRDMTANSDGPKHAGRIKRIWNIGDDRFLACATYGTFISCDGGDSWNSIKGAYDVLHVRRLFRAKNERIYLATQDSIFVSSDMGQNWKAVKWNGNGLDYGKLSGIAVVSEKLIWGGEHGLYIGKFMTEEPSRYIEAIGKRKIEDVIAIDDNNVIVLCNDGAIFSLDATIEEAKLLIQLPFTDGKTIIKYGNDFLILGKKTIQRVHSNQVFQIRTPDEYYDDYHYSFNKTHIIAFNDSCAWIGSIRNLKWTQLNVWLDKMKKPDVALSSEGKYAILTDGYRLWRIRFSHDQLDRS